MNIKLFIILIIICIVGVNFRTYNLLWDHGYSLHPDERAIVMITGELQLPATLSDFLSKDSTLNPNFFAYGSLPLYLLMSVTALAREISPEALVFSDQLLLGRYISVIADMGTLILVFLFGRLLFSKYVGVMSAGIYAISVFPIQAAHFYAVDISLTFFMTLSLYTMIKYFYSHKIKFLLLSGFSFGLALSTKISAAPLILPLSMLLVFLPISSVAFKNVRSSLSLKNIGIRFTHIYLFVLIALITMLLCQPYAFIDYHAFIADTKAQSAMTESAFAFPYTLQYVGKTLYLYELKNVFFWGLGPIISLLVVGGIIASTQWIIKTFSDKKILPLVSILLFCFFYFAIVGSFAVGWMRYMLPLYPYFALLAGLALVSIIFPLIKKIPFLTFKLFFIGILFVLVTIWTFTFMSIYSNTHTRVTASYWILQNIPAGSSLGIEHWDDHLPLFDGDRYTYIEYPLYDTDTTEKWKSMNEKINLTDYIILSSNRLYTPLQKMTDCKNLPDNKCYRVTADYYQKLFSGDLGFYKVAEFTNYPTIPIVNIPIIDESADESFSVYDHPKVMIFKKMQQ